MCSFHAHCTHNDASCWAQRPNSAGPINAVAANPAAANARNSLSITDAMGAIWSADLAKKYPHLL
uniref:Uncharacterized protein n=1 Tax=Romanomermis culicivorax TaxID=13658 RepID=A0A915JDK7_ROMCU